MKISDVIKKPILSEKAYAQMEKGIYTFFVDDRSKKKDVAKAVNIQFAVDAIRVNVSTTKSKTKRISQTRKTTQVGGGKKAIVWLKTGQKITALNPKPAAKTKEKSKDKKEKEVEKVSTEGKEA